MATFYVDMKTGQQLSKSQLVPGKTYIESGTGAQYTAPQTTSSPSSKPSSVNTGSLAPNQRKQYDQLVAAGADSATAMNAAKLVPVPTAQSTAPTIQPGGTGTVNGEQVTFKDLGNGNVNVIGDNGSVRFTTSKTIASQYGYSEGQSAQSDAELNTILANPNLSADQKEMLKTLNNVVETGDMDMFERLTAAMTAAKEFSDPHFKAQIRLVTDALDRGLSSQEDSLEFNVKQRETALQELKADIAASKDHLGFQQRQELESLGRDYESRLDSERNNLAATGFTNSTRRQRTEGIINETYGDAVESSNRTLGYQTGNLDRQAAGAQQNTIAEINNLRRLASEGKLNLLRQAEERTGSGALGNLGYGNLLGGVGGQIPIEQLEAQKSWANASNFVF